MTYKCVIFDNDGVLVDSEAISNRVLVDMAASVGVSMELDDAIENFSGVSMSSTLDYLKTHATREFPDDFEAEFRRRTFELFKTDLKPVDGVVEVLRQLEQAGIPFCVASSGPREKIRLSLSTTGLIQHFDKRIFSSYDINSWKPNPDFFLYAAREMGFQPGDCAVIEDSLAGVKAAKAGGFEVFAYGDQKNQSKLETLGAKVFFEMKELAHWLEIESF
jgi:HAD superfamily hydrolase (TIGR01509 family)